MNTTTIPLFYDITPIRVCFRRDSAGEITAVFLSKPLDRGRFVCYEHVGQHGLCDQRWVRETRPAKPAEYSNLKRELESIGYSVTVSRRMFYPRPGEIVCPKCGARIKPDKEEYERICREEDARIGAGFKRMSLEEWAKRNHECKTKNKNEK